MKLPSIFINVGLNLIADTIKEKINVDIFELNPAQCVINIHIPAFFICAKDDNFVRKHHTEDLFRLYKGSKKFASVTGGHNGDRPFDVMIEIVNFFKSNFDKKKNITTLHLEHKVSH